MQKQSNSPARSASKQMDGENMSHRSPLHSRQGGDACATFNLVVPLAHRATATRITDTAAVNHGRSGAVSRLIGTDLLPSDIDSTNGRSTQPIQVTRGFRISTMAIRTTTTKTMSCRRGLFA